MNMIEKLGIEPIELIPYCDDCVRCDTRYTYLTFEEDDVRNLEGLRNEMLEALIELIDYQINMTQDLLDDCSCELCELAKEKISVIEKATGKTWEEIKELNND